MEKVNTVSVEGCVSQSCHVCRLNVKAAVIARLNGHLRVCLVIKPHPRLQVFERVREDDVEDGVRSTALLVHVGGGDSAGFIPL